MTTASDTESALAFVRAEFQRLTQDVEVAHIPGMAPSMFGVYGFMLQRGQASALVAITWEAMISAYNDVQYRNAQFKDALAKAVKDFTASSGAGKHSYVISTRGLRVEAAPSDSQTLRALAGLEEAVKIGEEFVNKLKQGAA